ncbi:MAG TPA: M14 family zinc carboxypeptidase [Acidobacteriota bacterium]|nr:M14 family zinc carboxypeptidase [Acidobacteriota bacterium]
MPRNKTPLKRIASLALPLAFFVLTASARPQVPTTPGEAVGYKAYTQNEDIALFLSLADASSAELAVRILGRTKDVDGYAGRDIFLCILTGNGATEVAALDRFKPTLLLTASQHGNEQSAKEAALRFVRDLAFGDLKPLLKAINVLVIPQSNPYGNFFDVRENEIGLDLNRDHVKLESESVRALHRVYREWTPELTMDVHEKGDDYYRVSIGCVSNANIAPAFQEFSRNVLLTEVAKALAAKRVAFHEYLITEDLGVDTSSGAKGLERADRGPVEKMKRYSTTDLNDGRNGPGIYESLSFIQEGASRHDIETLESRTGWQYAGIRAFASSVAAHAGEVLKMVENARRRLLERAASRADSDPVHLRMDYVRDPKVPELVIKQFAPAESEVLGVLKIEKKAGEEVLETDLAPADAPAGRKVVTEVVKHWFPNVAPTLSVPRPIGYVIPSARTDVVRTLLDHGVAVEVFAKDLPVEVEAYTFTAFVPAKEDYLAPETVEVEKKATTTIVRKGDLYVDCGQAAANLIPSLLEPQSAYGLIRYQKYRLVPDKSGIFAIYRIEKKQDMPLIPYKPW